jgi:EF hand
MKAAAVLGGSQWSPSDVNNSATTSAQIKQELKALFKKADADNSGEIEYSEFKQVHFTVTRAYTLLKCTVMLNVLCTLLAWQVRCAA